MQPLSPTISFDAAVLASAAASARLDEFPTLRKSPPRFGDANVPGHFLKHADEQTVIALEAVRRAVERFDLDPREQTNWGIVGAPRFIGRLASVEIVRKFAQAGGATVATHAAAQFSLNSISGAASIVLGVRGPSVGVGGGTWSIGNGLVSAMTMFDPASTPGVWLLMTQWEPEPFLKTTDELNPDSVCHAVALALMPGVAGSSTLRLCLPSNRAQESSEGADTDSVIEPAVSQLVACLEAAHGGLPVQWNCRLPGGGSVELQLAAQSARSLIAA